MKKWITQFSLGGLVSSLLLAQTLALAGIALLLVEAGEISGDSPLLLAVPLLSAAVTAAVWWLMRRRLAIPARQAADTVEAFYSGTVDRGRRLAFPQTPELQPLADACNGLADRLQPLTEVLAESTRQFSAAANEIASTSAGTAQRMQQQEHETRTIGAAITGMASAVTQVAEQAHEAAEHVVESDKLAQTGKEVMTSAIGSVMALSSDVTQASEVIVELGEKSRDIREVLDVINGVAEQTNLLALNAAIEAARAGEQGRGFAVVADEVRTLASRTQQSTQEIQDMITGLQDGTVNAVKVMEGAQSKAQESSDLVEKAAISLATIAGSVSAINDMNTLIASAAEEQSAVAGEMQANMNNIREVADRSAEGAQQTAQASEELARLAAEQQSLMSKFKM